MRRSAQLQRATSTLVRFTLVIVFSIFNAFIDYYHLMTVFVGWHPPNPLKVFVGLFFATLVRSACGVWSTVVLLGRAMDTYFKRCLLLSALIVGLPANMAWLAIESWEAIAEGRNVSASFPATDTARDFLYSLAKLLGVDLHTTGAATFLLAYPLLAELPRQLLHAYAFAKSVPSSLPKASLKEICMKMRF